MEESSRSTSKRARSDSAIRLKRLGEMSDLVLPVQRDPVAQVAQRHRLGAAGQRLDRPGQATCLEVGVNQPR